MWSVLIFILILALAILRLKLLPPRGKTMDSRVLWYAFFPIWVYSNAFAFATAIFVGSMLFIGVFPIAHIAMGLAIGIVLSLALPGRLAGRGLWVAGNALGFTLGAFGAGLVEIESFIVYMAAWGALWGLIAGLIEWSSLRGQVPHAQWWIALNTMALAAGMSFMPTAANQTDDVLRALRQGAFVGVLTGAPLAWLLGLRRPAPDE